MHPGTEQGLSSGCGSPTSGCPTWLPTPRRIGWSQSIDGSQNYDKRLETRALGDTQDGRALPSYLAEEHSPCRCKTPEPCRKVRSGIVLASVKLEFAGVAKSATNFQSVKASCGADKVRPDPCCRGKNEPSRPEAVRSIQVCGRESVADIEHSAGGCRRCQERDKLCGRVPGDQLRTVNGIGSDAGKRSPPCRQRIPACLYIKRHSTFRILDSRESCCRLESVTEIGAGRIRSG